MNYLKTLLCALCLTLSVNTLAQTTEKDALIKDLKKLTQNEIEEMNIMLDHTVTYFDQKGKKITVDGIYSLMGSGNYTFDIYANNAKEVKALAARLKSAEELAMERKSSGTAETQQNHSAEGESSMVGKPAPPFTVTDINGNEYSLETLKGKVVVLNLWFIQCKPCIIEMPELNGLVSKYKNDDVVFLGISISDSKEDLKEFLSTTQFDYAIVPKNRSMMEKFNSNTFPTNIIIDKNGIVAFKSHGYSHGISDQMDRKINRMLRD